MKVARAVLADPEGVQDNSEKILNCFDNSGLN